MSVDPVGESVHRTDHDVLGKLAAIDQRLHQIQTQLNTMSKLSSQLDEISANLETLRSWNGTTNPLKLTSSQVAGSIMCPSGLLISFRLLIESLGSAP